MGGIAEAITMEVRAVGVAEMTHQMNLKKRIVLRRPYLTFSQVAK